VVGVQCAARAIDFFSIAKLLPLALLIVLGLPHLDAATIAGQAVPAPDWSESVLVLMFALGGFESALLPAGEMRDPRRDVAFALLTGLAVVSVIYLLVQVVVIGTVPHAAGSNAPIADALAALLGPVGLLLGSLGAMVSVVGWMTGAFLGQPRVIHAMADRGELPRVLSGVHSRFRTPAPAILLFAGVSLALAFAGNFAANATFAAIVRMVYYGLTCAALIVLRKKGGEPPGFRLHGGPVIAVLAVGFCAWLLATRSFEQAWILAALIAAGLPFYLLGRRKSGRV
jgi:amino acid transporter